METDKKASGRNYTIIERRKNGKRFEKKGLKMGNDESS